MRVIETVGYSSREDLARLSANDREYFYNGLDCCVTLELYEKLMAEMESLDAGSNTPLARTIYERSLALRGPILEMSMRGIRVDHAQRATVIEEKEAQHARVHSHLTRLMRDGLGHTFNYRSTTDLKHFFYSMLGLPPIRKRNAKGIMVPTVNREALERLQSHFWAEPICLHIITLRELDKQLSFLRTGIDPDGRIRSTFNIAGTKTGRLASSMSEFGTGTNLQNVDRLLRTVFIPDPGMIFINIDLEQGDSRNMGAMMWEVFYEAHGPAFAGSYLDACESGDLHTAVAKMTWRNLGWPGDPAGDKKIAEQLFYRQDSYRQTAKKLGHGTNYMGSARNMALHTKMPVHIIDAFQQSYFRAFPVIPEYHKWIREQITQYRQLTTLHSRRRYFFGRPAEKTTLNEAVAYPSQSMTADAVNIAMIKLFNAKLPVQLLCQVHDSLLLQAPINQVAEIIPPLLEICKAPLTLRGGREFVVPNEAKTGFNWGDEDAKKNPLGLRKWKGADDRRPPERRRFSLDALL